MIINWKSCDTFIPFVLHLYHIACRVQFCAIKSRRQKAEFEISLSPQVCCQCEEPDTNKIQQKTSERLKGSGKTSVLRLIIFHSHEV